MYSCRPLTGDMLRSLCGVLLGFPREVFNLDEVAGASIFQKKVLISIVLAPADVFQPTNDFGAQKTCCGCMQTRKRYAHRFERNTNTRTYIHEEYDEESSARKTGKLELTRTLAQNWKVESLFCVCKYIIQAVVELFAFRCWPSH